MDLLQLIDFPDDYPAILLLHLLLSLPLGTQVRVRVVDRDLVEVVIFILTVVAFASLRSSLLLH